MEEASSFEPLVITLNDPCYQPYSIEVDKSITPIFWANVFTYFIGFPVDYFTGALWDYPPVVTIPLLANDNATANCNALTQTATAPQILPSIPRHVLKKNRISAGFTAKTHSQRYADSYSGFGSYLEYAYALDSEFMVSLRVQANHTSDYVSNCDSCSVDIRTDQRMYAISLRHYLNLSTNFYAGLGVAHIFVDQWYNAYDFNIIKGTNPPTNNNYSELIRAQNDAIYLDVGWQSRDSSLSFNINTMFDLADLRLGGNDLKYRDKDLTYYDNKIGGKLASNRFLNAGVISNVNLGMTLAF